MQGFKQTGKWYDELNTPPIPYEIEQEWLWFLDLTTRRPQGFSGVCAIPFSEYLAWMEYSGHKPNLLQKKLLMSMDDVLVELLGKEADRDAK